jgi:phosphoribosylamine--glycine ligase
VLLDVRLVSVRAMRFLGIGETCDLGDLYLALLGEGHEVRISVSEPLAQGTLAGLCPRTADWRRELDWIGQAGPDGVILFEAVSEGLGALQDRLRAQGFNVVGGSAYGDRLENDRLFAQQVLSELGFPQGHVWKFDDAEAASSFIAERPGRYVLKYNGGDHASGDNYVGRCADGRDVAAMLRCRQAAAAPPGDGFILMQFVEGVEMGVGAYFDGTKFLRPACLDWEHKRFFAGDLGELTGEMGTVVTYDRTERFFEQTLARMESRLREHRHVGYVNLNTIVNATGVWPLEFTSRFGYPGFAILAPLQGVGWGELFRRMVARGPSRIPVRPGFCVGVVLTTPPFPYTRKQISEPVGLPVLIDPEVDPRHVHFGEVGLDPSGQLATSGLYGWTLVVTGEGPTIAAAQAQAYGHVSRIVIPNARNRLDIGERLIAGDYAQVERLGLLDAAGSEGLTR